MTPPNTRAVLADVTIPWFRLCYIKLSRDAGFQSSFGEPVTRWIDGMGAANSYAVCFACGLKVVFDFPQLDSGLTTVSATLPSLQHVRRHLKTVSSEIIDLTLEEQEAERAATIAKFIATHSWLATIHAHQVYRMGDDGNAIRVGEPTDQVDAECWIAELESHFHKQIYWVETLQSPANRE